MEKQYLDLSGLAYFKEKLLKELPSTPGSDSKPVNIEDGFGTKVTNDGDNISINLDDDIFVFPDTEGEESLIYTFIPAFRRVIIPDNIKYLTITSLFWGQIAEREGMIFTKAVKVTPHVEEKDEGLTLYVTNNFKKTFNTPGSENLRKVIKWIHRGDCVIFDAFYCDDYNNPSIEPDNGNNSGTGGSSLTSSQINQVLNSIEGGFGIDVTVNSGKCSISNSTLTPVFTYQFDPSKKIVHAGQVANFRFDNFNSKKAAGEYADFPPMEGTIYIGEGLLGIYPQIENLKNNQIVVDDNFGSTLEKPGVKRISWFFHGGKFLYMRADTFTEQIFKVEG